MGIKHFFFWLKSNFSENIRTLDSTQTLSELSWGNELGLELERDETEAISNGTVVDNFMIDMNGLFHNSAQRIYEYGAFAPQTRLLGGRGRRQNNRVGGLQRQIKCFEHICETIEMLVKIVNPQKRLILCVDGPAPLSKQNQQRQRRFRSAMERNEATQGFDSNSITPGTKWMDFLSKYVDWWIRKKMTEKWHNLEIVFSNEKSPGEGEHKIINFMRHHGNPQESYCIHGADADLIMLSLGTHFPKFYILRDDMHIQNAYFCLDIGGIRENLKTLLKWEGDLFDGKSAVNDFILMCFMVGNDFLPHIPAIEIIQGGIDTMIDVYKRVCTKHGHLTEYVKNDLRFAKKPMRKFLRALGKYEKTILQEKLKHRNEYFSDPLLDAYSREDPESKSWSVNIKQYRKEYYNTMFESGENAPKVNIELDVEHLEASKVDIEHLCHEYLEGMQWVLTYYTSGVPNWKWRYPHHYAPFSHTLAKHLKTFKFPLYGTTKPTTPFIQLLSVLPPKSSSLIPAPLNTLLTSKDSPLKPYCPDDFKVDVSGKRQEWEGIVILPMIDYTLVEQQYNRLFSQIGQQDTRRNILGKSFVYTYSPSSQFHFKSFYGDINCTVKCKPIEL